MSINCTYFLVLLLSCLCFHACDARVSRDVLKEPTINHLFTMDTKKLDTNNIPTLHGTKKSSVPYEGAHNVELLKFELKSDIKESHEHVEQMSTRKDSRAKVSSASVSWKLSQQKGRELEKPVFLSDYSPPEAHPPTYNIGS